MTTFIRLPAQSLDLIKAFDCSDLREADYYMLINIKFQNVFFFDNSYIFQRKPSQVCVSFPSFQ